MPVNNEYRVDTSDYHIRFTESEMVKVNIVPIESYVSLILLVGIALSVFAGLGGLVAGGIGAVIAYAAIKPIAERNRRRISRVSVEEIAAKVKSVQRIPWSDVIRCELNGRRLFLWTQEKRYGARINKSDIEPVKLFMKSKLGEKLSVK